MACTCNAQCLVGHIACSRTQRPAIRAGNLVRAELVAQIAALLGRQLDRAALPNRLTLYSGKRLDVSAVSAPLHGEELGRS